MAGISEPMAPIPATALGPVAALYRLYIGIADGTSIARVWARRYSNWPPRRGGQFEHRHAHTRAMDMLSAMPI